MAPIGFGSAQPPIGLDIGTDFVRAAQVRSAGGGFALSAYGRAPMPFGAVVEGEIVDPQAAGSAISELWKQSGFRTKDVAIGVSNQKVVVRLIDLPFMEKSELEGAIQYQAQDYIPIPVEEAILSHDVIGDYMTPADEHMMEVLLVAAARDVVNSAVQTVESAGLKLARIDVTAFAIVRALLGVDSPVVPDSAEGATGIIHISSGLTNIAVVERGVPRFTRVSALAGKQFTQAIANVLNLTYDEAEQLKIQVGLPSLDGGASSFRVSIPRLPRRPSRRSSERPTLHRGGAPLARLLPHSGEPSQRDQAHHPDRNRCDTSQPAAVPREGAADPGDAGRPARTSKDRTRRGGQGP